MIRRVMHGDDLNGTLAREGGKASWVPLAGWMNDIERAVGRTV